MPIDLVMKVLSVLVQFLDKERPPIELEEEEKQFKWG